MVETEKSGNHIVHPRGLMDVPDDVPQAREVAHQLGHIAQPVACALLLPDPGIGACSGRGELDVYDVKARVLDARSEVKGLAHEPGDVAGDVDALVGALCVVLAHELRVLEDLLLVLGRDLRVDVHDGAGGAAERVMEAHLRAGEGIANCGLAIVGCGEVVLVYDVA